MKSQILDAQSKSKSARGCARYLKVSFPTYKKWATYHGVYENLLNKNGKGIKKIFPPKPSMIHGYTSGQKSHDNPRLYLKQLIRHEIKEPRCEHCGYNECRIDGKMPLLINYIDGQKRNSHIDNIQILCYSCYYVVVGVELIGNRKRRYYTPSYVNTARNPEISKFDEDLMLWDDFDMDEVDEMDLDVEKRDDSIDELFNKLNK